MSFTNLKIENFGLIREFESDFNNLGLVLIQGDNPESQVADSNDAGKTTLFEALLWGVWGKTIKGGKYKGKKVINWDCKQAKVEIGFLGTDGTEYTITRIEHRADAMQSKLSLDRDAVSLTQVSKAETQLLIDQLLGIDFLTFTNTVIFGQHQVDRFASLTDAATKDIFSKILDFELYDLALAETKRRLKETASEINDIEREIMSLQMQIQRSREFIDDADGKRDAFEEEKEGRLLALGRDMGAYKSKLKKATENLFDEEELLQQKETSEIVHAEATEKRATIREEAYQQGAKATKLQNEHVKLETTLKDVGRREVEYTKEIERIVSTDVCPECETAITVAKKKQLASKYEEKLADTLTKMKDMTGRIDKLKVGVKKLLASTNKLKEEDDKSTEIIRDQRIILNDIDKKLGVLEATSREVRAHEDAIKRLDVEAERVKEETFSLGDMVEKETDKIDKAKASLVQDKKKQKKLEKLAKRLEFWREGFGNAGIKSLLTEQVIPFLNDRAEQFSKILTGGEVKITFKGQTQLKSGEFRDRFGTDIELVGGGKDSCYDSTGGGFRRRTDLVIAFALRDLIMSQSRYKPNMTVYDECFAEVDETGCETLLSFLEEQADEIGTVFVITHNKKLAAQFQNTWQVTRDGKESKVEVL